MSEAGTPTLKIISKTEIQDIEKRTKKVLYKNVFRNLKHIFVLKGGSDFRLSNNEIKTSLSQSFYNIFALILKKRADKDIKIGRSRLAVFSK